MRLVRAATYLLSLSVRPARAAISGRPCHAHVGMVTACESALRSRGGQAQVTRKAISFLRLPPKEQGRPIRPFIFFRHRRAAFLWRGLGMVWDSGPTLL